MNRSREAEAESRKGAGRGRMGGLRGAVPAGALVGLLLLAGGAARGADELLPIPEVATPEQIVSFEEVVAEARKNDVSVTPQAAILYKGLMLTQDEEYEEAIPYLEEALRRDPSLQPGWEGLGWSYIRTGDVPKATRLWEYFWRLMPEQALPYSLLAQVAILRKDWDAADGFFRQSLKISPKQYDVRFWFAQNLMRLGKVEEAEAILRELIEEDPDRLDVQLNLASLLNQRLGYDEAVDIYRHIYEEYPGVTKLMLEQAVLEMRVGEIAAANRLCLEILEEEPDNTEAMKLRADIAEIAGQQDIEPLVDVLNSTDDPITRANLRVRLANRCHLANQRTPGQYDTDFILDLIHDAIDDDPAEVQYHLLYAERLLEAGRADRARTHAVKVLEEMNRHNTRAKTLLFEIALRERRFDDAEQILADRFSNFDATDPMEHYYRARILTSQGYFQEAMKEVDQMEAAANQGAVLTLLYHDLTESDWMPVTSVRRLHEHIMSLQQEGWILISPTDLPKHVGLAEGERRADAELEEEPPLTARLFDWLRWCVTGTRKFKTKRMAIQDVPPPQKYFAVTFDDGLRSSLVLGTQVAEDFGVPFGMFVPTEPSKEYVPSRAGWEELRRYVATGHWVVGSELYASYQKRAVDEDGQDIRAPLVNRLWLPDRLRVESMNEWDRRMRREFRESREVLKRELGEMDSETAMVAYPYGDVGQEGACNLLGLKNPMGSVLSEAERTYAVGFVQNMGGYTVSGDNLLQSRRYEPSWTAEGADVVRHAYEYHPTFIARRMRAEIAMLMNKPNLAGAMLDALRRDGYPDELCRQVEAEMRTHFRNRPALTVRPLVTATQTSTPLQDEEPRPSSSMAEALKASGGNPEAHESTGQTGPMPSGRVKEGQVESGEYHFSPEVGVYGTHSKANDQIETVGYGFQGAVNLTRATTLSGQYSWGEMKQSVRPHWNTVVISNATYEQSLYRFKMETSEWRLGLTHRFDSGLIISAAGGRASKTQRTEGVNPNEKGFNLQDDVNSHKFTLPGDDDATVINVTVRWNPADALSLACVFDRNYVPSAVKNVTYESFGAYGTWKPEDEWLLDARAQYWSYSDDNAMYSGKFESVWETNPELGIWTGLQLSTVSTSEGCDFYWTPYWDQRVMGLLRYQQSWEGYRLTFNMLGGMQRQLGRASRQYETTVEEEKDVMVDGVANTVKEEKTEYVTLSDAATGWHAAWGFAGSYEKRLTRWLVLEVEGEVIALREYIDHACRVGLSLRL